MSFYQFKCFQCIAAPEKNGRHLSAEFVLDIPISKAPPIGSKRQCPLCKKVSAIRILSTGIDCVVRGNSSPVIGPSTKMMASIHGKEIPISFCDHPHTDPAVQRQMAELGRKAGIGNSVPSAFKHAYRNKDGRLVVDVASSIPDPLGALSRSKQSGQYAETKRRVNQPYRVRNPKRKK